MLSKCANPSCSTPLVYLREGKIFMMEAAPSGKKAAQSIVIRPKPVNRVEHFWLCGPCSSSMTLVFDREQGVQVVEKTVTFLRAAAS